MWINIYQNIRKIEGRSFHMDSKGILFFGPVGNVSRKAKLEIKNRWTDIDICFYVGSKLTQPSALMQN